MPNQVAIPFAVSADIILLLIDTGGILDGAKLHLYKNNFTPSAASVLADFTPCDFTNYAVSSAVVWGTPGVLSDGTPVVTAGSKQFQAGSPLTTPGVAYGWYLTDTGGTTLLAAKKFDSVVNMVAPDQILDVIASYPVAYPGTP